MYMTSNKNCIHRYTITNFTSSDNINFKIEYVCDLCMGKVIAEGKIDEEHFKYVCNENYKHKQDYGWEPTWVRNGDGKCISQQIIGKNGHIGYILLNKIVGNLDHM